MALSMLTKSGVFGFALAGDSAARLQLSAERRAPSAERRAPSAERRAPSAERRAPSAERRAPSAERRAGHDCGRTCAEPHRGLSLPVLPPATRAGLPNPLCFLFAVPRPRTGSGAGSRCGVRGSLAALVLFALAVFAPAGPAQSQTEVHSTTITVGGAGTNITGWFSFTGSVDNFEFTYKGTDFEFAFVYRTGSNLRVGFNVKPGETAPTYASAYSLCLDGEKHAGWTGAFTTQYSASSSLSWTNGQRVAVRLVEGTSCGSTPETVKPLVPEPGQTHPAVPGLKVTATGRTSVRLTWDIVGEENSSAGWAGTGQYTSRSYDVYWKSGAERYSGQRTARVHHARRNDRAAMPYADIDHLTHGRTYSVRVRASQFALEYNAQGKLTGVAREILALSDVTFAMDGERGAVLYPKSATPRPNTAPAFTDAPAAQTATEGEEFAYTVPEARDGDGDAVVYAAALADGGDLPEWLSFDPAARTFSGTPGAADTGRLDIAVTATDDGAPPLSATGAFGLTVREADAPPPPATPPAVSAGADMEGRRGGTVTLAGAGTLNAGGSQDPLAYRWRIVGASHAELKAGTSWLSDADQATATFSVPRRRDVTDRRAVDNGQWIGFELTATDGDGETATDTVRVTIRGSTWNAVRVSVADASAAETAGSMAFAVTLSQAARDAVSVTYRTSDGTALAGSDYTAASGRLTFRPGETSKTVAVAIRDDLIDDGGETFTLTLEYPTPVGTLMLGDKTATGTITNSDPLQKDWLARFGRAAAADAVAAVTARLETPRDAGSHFTLGGHRLPLDGSGNAGASSHLPPVLTGSITRADRLAWSDHPAGGTSRAMSMRELLMGTSFRAVFGNGAGLQLTGWGQGASVSRFSGGTQGLSLSGETATGSMGMDYERGRLLAGFALTHSLGAGTAHGLAGRSYAMGSTVTAMLPYARVALSEGVSAWGMAGTGTGRLTLDLDGSAVERYGADLAMSLAAVGMKGDLVTPAEAGGFALAFRADAFRVRTESAAVSTPGVGNLAGARADASRLRAMLDGSRTFMLAGGGTLTPSVELGVRHDGGDAETGTGLELGAGLGWADPSRGLDMTVKVQGLAAHAEDSYDEWSVSGQLRLVPGAAGRGLSMSLTPSWGADPGSSERLWLLPDASALAANSDATDPQARLDAELGYGLAVSGGLTGTPHVGFGLSETAREVRLGWRLNPAGGGGFGFHLDAARRDSGIEGDPETEHRVGFGITSRW